MEVINHLLLWLFYIFCCRSVSVWFCAKKLFSVGFSFLTLPSEGCLTASRLRRARPDNNIWVDAKSVGRVSNSRWDETVVAFGFHPMLCSADALLTPVAYLLAYFLSLHDDSVTDWPTSSVKLGLGFELGIGEMRIGEMLPNRSRC